MALRSSISSSDLAPTPAFWIAAVTAAVLGFSLSGVEASFPNSRREAYRFNASNGRRPAQVLLLGTSRMRHGVIEERLEGALGERWQAINLGLDSAGLGEMAALARLLDAPRGDGPRVAVVEVHPALFDTGVCRVPPPAPAWRALWPAKRPLSQWLPDLAYGRAASWFPRLVPVPPPLPRLLWTVDAEARRRAVAAMTPAALAAAARSWRFDESCLRPLRALSRTLKERGYRVILLEPPSHSAYAAALPDGGRLRAALEPKETGADRVLSLADARALGAGDSVFYDYSHLSPEGARLQTDRLAALLCRLERCAGPGHEAIVGRRAAAGLRGLGVRPGRPDRP